MIPFLTVYRLYCGGCRRWREHDHLQQRICPLCNCRAVPRHPTHNGLPREWNAVIEPCLTKLVLAN